MWTICTSLVNSGSELGHGQVDPRGGEHHYALLAVQSLPAELEETQNRSATQAEACPCSENARSGVSCRGESTLVIVKSVVTQLSYAALRDWARECGSARVCACLDVSVWESARDGNIVPKAQH